MLIAVIQAAYLLVANDSNALNFLGYFQLITCVLIWFSWAIFQLPLDLKSAVREFHDEAKKFSTTKKNENKIEKANKFTLKEFNYWIYFFYFIASYMISNSYLLYLTTNILFTVLGLTVQKVFYILLLLDIVDRSIVLQNVTRSITVNAKQLLMTALLGIVIVLIYSLFGYYISTIKDTFVFTQNTGKFSVCNDPLTCFTFILNFGLRQGGGVGDAFYNPNPITNSGKYFARFAYDLSFFIIIIIIWLNIIFGIIIDTFAELRDVKRMRGFYYFV